MFNVINEDDVRRFLQRDNLVLTPLLVQCAYRGLLCEPAALEEVEDYPRESAAVAHAVSGSEPWVLSTGSWQRRRSWPSSSKLEQWLLEAIRRKEDWLERARRERSRPPPQEYRQAPLRPWTRWRRTCVAGTRSPTAAGPARGSTSRTSRRS